MHVFVFRDSNGDGVHDDDEPGLPGVLIELFGPGPGMVRRASTQPLASCTTDASGMCHFSGLQPGLYTVSPARPEGFFFTTEPGTQVDLLAGQTHAVQFGVRSYYMLYAPISANNSRSP
jgi:hypothetical protein